MRVIAGLGKGYRLLGPKSTKSRPTEDKIKESVFNVLYPLRENSVILDLFSCTGSIGIEFLSRGSKKVFFSESNYDNIRILNENLEKTRFLEQAEVLQGDFKKNILRVYEDIDYVYIDPPYYSDFYTKALHIMKDIVYFRNAYFIFEADKRIDVLENFNCFELVFQRRYGKKEISIYKIIDLDERKTHESNLSG